MKPWARYSNYMSPETHEVLDIDTQIVSHGTHEAVDASIRLCRGECMKPRV